jgi:hypothetical protein
LKTAVEEFAATFVPTGGSLADAPPPTTPPAEAQNVTAADEGTGGAEADSPPA